MNFAVSQTIYKCLSEQRQSCRISPTNHSCKINNVATHPCARVPHAIPEKENNNHGATKRQIYRKLTVTLVNICRLDYASTNPGSRAFRLFFYIFAVHMF